MSKTINVRTKGSKGEREFIRILSEKLGLDLKRNLQQFQESGCDVLRIPDWAIEIKRHEKLSLEAWWRQAVKNANTANRIPALAYRQSYKPWRIIIPIDAIVHAHSTQSNYALTAELSIDGFCEVQQNYRWHD